MRKRAYRSTLVKQIKLSDVVSRLSPGPVWAGLDIGKQEILVVVRDSSGAIERPWKVKNPSELKLLTGMFLELAQSHEVKVAMESTGTYGDSLRQCLTDAGLGVHRVSGKAVSDYAETFDGVPSNHDGKDAAIIAELAAIGKARPWPLEAASAQAAEMTVEVTWLDAQQGILQVWVGRLEGLLARHWPELTSLMDLTRVTLLRLLAHYGDPAKLAADDQAAARLQRWGRSFLRPDKIAAIIASAGQTVGVRLDEATAGLLRRCAGQALAAIKELRLAERKLLALARQDRRIQAEGQAVGLVTACVLRVTVGDPADYHCGEAYRKAMGLNLKERSSGRHQGQLKITKRGSSLARRWLFFAALRTVKQQPVRTWYEAKRTKDNGQGTKGLIAVMRKMALAVYAISARGETFALDRLLPGKPAPRGPSGGGPA